MQLLVLSLELRTFVGSMLTVNVDQYKKQAAYPNLIGALVVLPLNILNRLPLGRLLGWINKKYTRKNNK